MEDMKLFINKLENGIKIYFLKVKNSKKIQFNLLSKTGSINEDKVNGIAHLLEHMNLMYFRFTKEESFVNKERLVSPKIYSCTGYTDFDRLVIKVRTNNKKESLENGLFLLKKIIEGKVLKERFLNVAKDEVLSECIDYERRNNNQLEIISYITEGKVNNLPMGKVEDIKKIKFSDIVNFHKKSYINNQLGIVICGDFNEYDVYDFALNIFNDIPNDLKVDKNNVDNTEKRYREDRFKEIKCGKDYEVLKIYYKCRCECSTLRKRLIRNIFDRLLEDYIYESAKTLEIIDVNCTDKRNIGGNDFYINVIRGENLKTFKNIYSSIIDELRINGFDKKSYNVVTEYLRSVIKEIELSNQIDIDVASEELIHKFYDNDAPILINVDYKKIIEELNSISIEEINELISNILNEGYRMVLQNKLKSSNFSENIKTRLCKY